MRPLLATGSIKGMAHITGGGITENLPRILPAGTAARVRHVGRGLFLACSRGCRKVAALPMSDMMRTFNMGIGLIVAVAPDNADQVKSASGGSVIGEIVPGEPVVTYVQ